MHDCFIRKALVVSCTILSFIIVGCGKDTKNTDNTPPAINTQSASTPATNPQNNWHKIEWDKEDNSYILLDQIVYNINADGTINRNLINFVQALELTPKDKKEMKRYGATDAAYALYQSQFNVSQQTIKRTEVWITNKDGTVVISKEKMPHREETLPLKEGTNGSQLLDFICDYCNDHDELILSRTNAQPQRKNANQVPTQSKQRATSSTSSGLKDTNSLDYHWFSDSRTGVLIWNPMPEEGESVSWQGGSVQDGAYRYADGNGVATWYLNGKFTQKDEGTYVCGYREGAFKQTFADGRVKYTNWHQGTRVD